MGDGKSIGDDDTLLGAARPTHSPLTSALRSFADGATGPLIDRQIIAKRYEILGLIGVGGMGCVYRARDIELDEVIALKVLRPELIEATGVQERFRQEVKLARRVTHRNVARTFDIGEHEGQKFLTMELIEGRSVSALIGPLGRPALPIARTLEIGIAVCDALMAAHAVGVVHRDLKPDNVLVATDGRVAITDFGIARAFEGAGSPTQTMGLGAGTPAYMAPEQVEGASVDARADIYALGTMLYEMLTAERAWPGESALAVASARLTSPPPDLRAKRSDLPPSLAELVLGCMARKPEHRYASAHDVGWALSILRAGLGDAAPTASRPGPHLSAAGLATPTSPVVPRLPTPHGGDVKTVAVLPFRNLGPADDDYLADGLTEDLIDVLSMVPGLKLRSRGAVMRFRGSDRDPRDIGAELDVQVVVDGSVRKAGANVRIATRLIGVADGFQLWAKRFDRPAADLLAVDAEAAQEIARALTVDPRRVVRDGPTDPIAIELLLRARHEYNSFRVDKLLSAIELLRQALERVPNDPLILSTYAMARVRLGFLGAPEAPRSIAEAKQAVARLLEIAPERGETHCTLAYVRLHEHDHEGCMRAIARAVAAAPSLAPAQELLGRLLLELNRIDEGIGRLQLALSLDPETPQAMWEIARGHALLGHWDKVEEIFALPVDRPGEVTGRLLAISRMSIWQRDPKRGAAAMQGVELTTDSLTFVKILSKVLSSETLDAGGHAFLEQLRNLAESPVMGKRQRAFWYQIRAEIAAFFGDFELALSAIHGALEVGLFDLSWMDRCPLLAELRTMPAFAPLRATTAARADRILAALSR